MVKVRFRCREMFRIKFFDKKVVPCSTIYFDPGTRLTQQKQDVPIATSTSGLPEHCDSFVFTRILSNGFQNKFCACVQLIIYLRCHSLEVTVQTTN